jgi:hypothetical protein
LTTALEAKQPDFGSFITAAEWLDVNYGVLVRELLLKHLGGQSITVIEPTAQPFPDAASTAAITTFSVGSFPKKIEVARASKIEELENLVTRSIERERFETEARWSHFTRARREVLADFIELGELCRVHRGSVTGANRVWIAGEHSKGLPEEVLFASVTRAKELFDAKDSLSDSSELKRVIDLPEDLDELDQEARKSALAFLKVAKSFGADQGYVASARRAWWSVGLRTAAPILATYMARRAPRFVRNEAEARHINIAHGLYPREVLSEDVLKGLSRFLSTAVSVHDGRTYAGGLTKFEPREMERLLVPKLEALSSYAT